jgi:hypothetical protein
MKTKNESMKKEKMKQEKVKQEIRKEAYELPRIAVRGIVLEGSLAAQSPVKSVSLAEWDEVSETSVAAEEVSFQVW